MRFKNRKDIKLRQKTVSSEKKNNFFKAVIRLHQQTFVSEVYFGLFSKFSKNFLTRLKNRCQFTFSKHSIIRFYHIGRHAFRSNASFGTFFGLQKSSW